MFAVFSQDISPYIQCEGMKEFNHDVIYLGSNLGSIL